MYEVTVEDAFSAAHFLRFKDGSREPRHGHDWKVRVTVQAASLDAIDVVVDFEELKSALRNVLSEFEKVAFNAHPEFRGAKKNPSTECIARLIYDRLRRKWKKPRGRVVRVTVFETPDACASYLP